MTRREIATSNVGIFDLSNFLQCVILSSRFFPKRTVLSFQIGQQGVYNERAMEIHQGIHEELQLGYYVHEIERKTILNYRSNLSSESLPHASWL